MFCSTKAISSVDHTWPSSRPLVFESRCNLIASLQLQTTTLGGALVSWQGSLDLIVKLDRNKHPFTSGIDNFKWGELAAPFLIIWSQPLCRAPGTKRVGQDWRRTKSPTNQKLPATPYSNVKDYSKMEWKSMQLSNYYHFNWHSCNMWTWRVVSYRVKCWKRIKRTSIVHTAVSGQITPDWDCP